MTIKRVAATFHSSQDYQPSSVVLRGGETKCGSNSVRQTRASPAAFTSAKRLGTDPWKSPGVIYCQESAAAMSKAFVTMLALSMRARQMWRRLGRRGPAADQCQPDAK
ncbi:MAG TPA: hypothetical protein PLU30_25155 [Verrucomicrobiae bacterium]|nr:hypothetical protein [Verrucomicrobiae bacterium]